MQTRRLVRVQLDRVVQSNLLANVLRWRARRRGFSDRGGITIVTVSWNSLEYLAVLLHAVRRFSPDDVQILVIDNHSTDGTREWLRRQPNVQRMLLPYNFRHGPALDIGFLSARTEFVVALDVDAFPVSDHWLEELLAPLHRDHQVAGVLAERRFAHPCCMAMRQERFVRERHTFKANFKLEGLGETSWDVGELISMREWPLVHLIEPTESIGPGFVGTTWADVAYHNFFAVRHQFHFGSADGALGRGKVTRADAVRAWDVAVQRYLGLDESARLALAAGSAGKSS